jgi:hypothetical protein
LAWRCLFGAGLNSTPALIGMIVFVIFWKALRVPRNSSNHNQGSRPGQVVDVKNIKVDTYRH